MRPLKFAIVIALLAAIIAIIILGQPSEREATAPAGEPMTVDSFIYTVKSGEPDEVKAATAEFLRRGFDLNKPDRLGRTPLTEALLVGRHANAQALLDAGADPKVAGREGYTPLILACNNGDAALVKALLDAGANPKRTNERGITALHTAGRSTAESAPLVEIVGALLHAGADPNAVDDEGFTPLMVFASRGRVDPMILLLDARADLEAGNALGMRAITYAIQSGDFASRASWDLDLSDPGPDALQRLGYLAVAIEQSDSIASVRLLLNRGADINFQENNGTTPIMRAATLGNIDAYTKIIADAGGDTESPVIRQKLDSLVRLAHGDQIVLALRNADAYVNLPNKLGADAMTVSRDRTDPVGKLIHGLLLEGKRVSLEEIQQQQKAGGGDGPGG
ncbi:MAG: ankyrin repeat domain-containing protein [Phycisphaeraceae bacterium]|nr:ankyrin repeat domain-containing protein [Phycisphaeraceae bacterium]MCB9848304.1 ankyrin repeat domain-containing protein [Phycisphaeraceae bacterium]